MNRSSSLKTKINSHFPLLALSLTAALLSFDSNSSYAAPAKTEWGGSEMNIWNDPSFKKQFIASYGINSEVEPRITPEEVLILEKIRPLMANNLPEAEKALKEVLTPESSATLDFTLGSIYFQQDRMDLSLQNYLRAVQKFPSFRRAWRNLGLIYARDSKFDDAIGAFTKMIELGGGDAYSYGLLGFSYASKQDYQAAEAAYRNALLLQPDNTEWRLGVTRCVFKQEKFEDAATLLEVLIARYPEKSDFWLLQAQAYIGLKQPLKAAQDLEALERLGKATVDSLQTLGDIYVNENLMELAAGAYVRSISINPSQSRSRPMQCAESLASRGAFVQAKQVASQIRKTWESQMDEAERRKLLKLEARLSMAEGTEGNDETVAVLEEIIKLDPLDGEALLMIGQHYSRQGDPDRAIFYYERASSIDAYEATAKIRHAQALVAMGRYGEAVPLLRRAQEVKPRDDVARYLEQVERISKTR